MKDISGKRETKNSIALKIDAITEQERRLYHEQDSIHKRLMILKEKKANLFTKFLKSNQDERQ